MNKNNYLMGQEYLLRLENDNLRDRIKKLAIEVKELKQMYEAKEREGMVQIKGDNAVIQER